MTQHSNEKPIAIYHEHPDWFKPLFEELDRRELPYVRLDAAAHVWDPSEQESHYSVVVNRASPSAYLRGHAQSTFHTLHWLKHLERIGVPVVNGSAAYTSELSKALQLDVLEELGLPYPRARVINHASQAPAAANGLRFPVVVKANIGGSGAGILRFDTPESLASASRDGLLDLGVDNTALVQELAPLRDGHITRVEVLGGKFLYAIKVYPADGSFNLCPADACQTTDGRELERTFCAADAKKNGMRVEAFAPPQSIIESVEKIAERVGLDIGGIEYLIDDRDGKPYYYDINALSNFVADAQNVIGFDPFVRFADYIESRAGIVPAAIRRSALTMRYGYWMPVFGGWLRNVPDEGMEASWEYVKKLAQRSEQIGYDLTLIAELFLNDIKGIDAPSLEAWSTAAALAAVTERLELMVAVRPTFHNPAILAKQAANLDLISNGRLSLNVVSSWWADEARRYGVQFDSHDDRYARTEEWLTIVAGAWKEKSFSHQGKYYSSDETVLSPKPAHRPRPTIYAGGESEAAKSLITRTCDAYVMHGDPPERIAPKVDDIRRRREATGLPEMEFGMAAYAIVRPTEREAKAELARITNVDPGSAGYHNYQDWISHTKLEQQVSLEDYSVSNRGLRAGLVGTPEQVAERVSEFQEAGVGLLLLQCSPQLEEMERFAAEVMPLTESLAVG